MQRLSGELLAFALTRRRAPAWIRERLAAGEDARRRRLADLAGLAREAVVLHTCERFEVYALAPDPRPGPFVERFAGWLSLEPREVFPHLETLRGRDATRHLLRVACGLESRLVGETQVRGQLLHGWRESEEAGRSGPLLSALVRAALHASRRVRSATSLGRGRESLVALVLRRLRGELGTLAGRVVLLAGTGSLAAEIAPALRAEGATVRVASRSLERAVEFAARFEAEASSVDDLVAGDAAGDALVACTNGVLPVDGSRLDRLATVLVDLGSPSNLNVAPDARARVVRLEDLECHAPGPEVRRAERLVAEEAHRFEAWRRGRAAVPLVEALLRSRPASAARPSPEERRALHLEIQRLKTAAIA